MNNGGPAFPVVTPIAHDGGLDAAIVEDGMSLRDYFAGHADLTLVGADDIEDIAAVLGIDTCDQSNLGKIRYGAAVAAAMRYIFADAMIEAREK